jgi:hypothetical protein
MPGIGVQDIRSRYTVLHRGLLSATTSTVLFTATSKTLVTNIFLANGTASERTVTLSLDGVALVSGIPVPPYSVISLDLGQALDIGKTIQGGASAAAAIACHITGQAVT